MAIGGFGFFAVARLVEVVADPGEARAHQQAGEVRFARFAAGGRSAVFGHVVQDDGDWRKVVDGLLAVGVAVELRRVVACVHAEVAECVLECRDVDGDRRVFRGAVDEAVRIQTRVGRGVEGGGGE